MPRERLLVLDLVALLLICPLAALVQARSIEEDIQAAVARRLAEERLGPVDVVADGRRVWLGGKVFSPQRRDAMALVAASVPGVSRVDHQLFVIPAREESPKAAPRREPHLEIGIFADTVYVGGLVPRRTVRDQLIRRIAALAGRRRITEEVAVQPRVADASWFSSVQGLLLLLEEGIEDPTVRIEGGDLHLGGTAPGPEVAERIRRLVARALPELEVLDELLIGPVRALTVFQLQTMLEGMLEKRSLRFRPGTSILSPASAETLDRVAEVLQQAPPEVRVEIACHVSESGRDPEDAELSFERARAVADQLARRGVPRERLTPMGYGASGLHAGRAAEGGPVSQRIELVVTREG